MNLKFLVILLIVILAGVTLWIYKNLNFKKMIIDQKGENMIGVTIMPLLEITKEIVKDKYKVELIIPAGADLHNFEISRQELEKIKSMRLIFFIDLGIDDWLVKNLKDYPIKLINLSQGVDLITTTKGIDPHFWFSIENMKKVSQKIEQEVEILDPARKYFYRQNLNNLLGKLDDLKRETKNVVKKIKQKNLIVQHDAFNYFAKELGLNIVGYLEDSNGEISFQKLQEVIKKINDFRIKHIFKVVGEESNVLNNLVQELNLKVYELDPMEGKGSLNYFEAYSNNLKVIQETLQ